MNVHERVTHEALDYVSPVQAQRYIQELRQFQLMSVALRTEQWATYYAALLLLPPEPEHVEDNRLDREFWRMVEYLRDEDDSEWCELPASLNLIRQSERRRREQAAVEREAES